MTVRRLALVAASVLLVACASDGRTLRPPAPGATAPPQPSVTSANSGLAAAGTPATPAVSGFTLSSTAFEPGQPIPIAYTCDAGGQAPSPPLAWGGVPTGTVELALTVVDPDANDFVHWVMAGIDPSVQAISIGNVPDGVVQGTNSGGSVGWTGPCPPQGPPHHYVFSLYALSSPSGLTQGVDGHTAITTLQNTHSAPATLTGTYQRAG